MKLKLRFLAVKAVPKLFWSSPKALTILPPIISAVVLIFGLILFGLGEALLIASGVGVSPWTVFAQGVTNVTGWSVGFATVVISICVLLLWIPLMQTPGLGTALNITISTVYSGLGIFRYSEAEIFTIPLKSISSRISYGRCCIACLTASKI